MTQRVVLRADGSGETGYGHFIRTLALAGYLKNDFDCHFATYNSTNILPTDYQFEEIAKVCDYIPLGETLEEANADFLDSLQPEDIVVLDNYYYTTDYQRAIKDKGCRLVCIDDMHDRKMVCNLLMTACPLKREDFSLEPYTKFVSGIEWAFLREPFLKPNIIRNIPSTINSVVIAMGGADPFKLTDKMIRVVTAVLPSAQINVMAGDTVTVSKESSNMAVIQRRLNAEQIVELFDGSDFGIFPASTVCMEAFSRKLPVAVGHYVNNQEEFYEYGVAHKMFYRLGSLLDDEEAITNRLRDIITNNKPVPTAIIDFNKQKKKIIDLFKDLSTQ